MRPARPADRRDFFCLIAEFLDDCYPADDAEVQFFRRVAGSPAGRLLELGIGTGRIGIPLARAGWPVTGADRSARALELLRGKVRAEPALSIRLVCGDVSELRIGGTFSVIVACGLFFHLADRAGYERLLRTAAGLLTQDGSFIFDVECRPDGGWFGDGLERFMGRIRVPDGWLSLRQASTLRPRLMQQWGVFTFEESDDEGNVRWRRVYHEVSSYTSLRCLAACVENAGLRIDQTWGGYDGTPYVDGLSPELIVRVRKT